MYYPVETRITPLTTIRRERLLPVPGQVLVRSGEVVGPSDVIARCHLPGEVRVVDVSRALGVRRDRIDKVLRKAVGDSVQANEVLAMPGGLFGRLRHSCRAPVEGQITAVRNGLVLIEAAAKTHELRAHVAGQIANVMPNRGVVISTSGALIQGVWGSGGESEGILKVVVDTPQRPIRPRSIDVSCHGTIIVGSWIMDEKVLEQAIEAKVRGIILGSVSFEQCSMLESLPFPVLITEGFGTVAMSQTVFDLLRSSTGREAMLSADIQTRWGAKRPEVLIPLRAEEGMPAEDPLPPPLEVGMQVRVVKEPHFGSVGAITDLPTLPQIVGSGGRMPVAEVDFGEDRALIALANLELIR
jgi:hypothetical protein